MESTPSISDNALLAEFGSRIERRRLDQNLTQAELAKEAGVSKRTVERLESGASTQFSNVVRVLRVLGLLANFEAMVPAPIASPIEQLRLRGKQRRRASSARRREEPKRPLTWGEGGGEGGGGDGGGA